jgi:hypothetical protein
VERPQDDLCGFVVGARIGAAFLPFKDSVATLLATFTELALGFVVRPHGVLFWGLARCERRYIMLFWALLLGGLVVVLVYVVPHYVAVGVATFVAVVLLRILLVRRRVGCRCQLRI